MDTPLAAQQAPARVRARDLGVAPGVFPPGTHNAITDVSGVLVGHSTVRDGDSVNTGVTAIRAHGGNQFFDRVPAAVFVGNAFGKLVGATQVVELGPVNATIHQVNERVLASDLDLLTEIYQQTLVRLLAQ